MSRSHRSCQPVKALDTSGIPTNGDQNLTTIFVAIARFALSDILCGSLPSGG